jgi:hypothetical protein
MQSCRSFAAYFKSVFTKHCMHDISTDFWSSDSLPIASVCDSNVHKTIKRLRPSKSVGIDGIHAFTIKSCFGILMSVLKFICNLSFSQRLFPTFWKQITIVPNFKKRETALVNNYRPIYVVSTFQKYSKLTYVSTFHII